jgi:LCP family protein required for cell wall assembly
MPEDPKPTATPADRAKRLARRWWQPAALALAALLAATLSAASVQAIRNLRAIDDHPKVAVPAVDPAPRDDYFSDRPRNVLVLGSDTRRGLSEEQQELAGSPGDFELEGERSDTIILLHIDPRRDQAVVVHFPRDLRVEIPGHGTDKINAAYELGGPNLAVRTVKGFTGLPIHNYVEVSLAGFQRIVDLMKGVQICIDRPMRDPLAGLNLPEAGCYWMDGRTALAFVRARHLEGDIIPDFSRIRRQQQFMRAFFNKLISIGSFLDADLIREAARQVTTDDQIEAVDLVSLGRELRKLAEEDPSGAESLDFRVVPGTPALVDDVSYVLPNEAKADQLFDALRTGAPLGTVGLAPEGLDESPAVIKVRVLQAGTFADAASVANQLRNSGFIVLETEPAPPSYRDSQILYGEDRSNRGRVVHGYPYVQDLSLDEGPPFVLDGADVAVVIGEDYRPSS